MYIKWHIQKWNVKHNFSIPVFIRSRFQKETKREEKKKDRWNWSKDLLVRNGYWYGYRKALNGSLHLCLSTQAVTTSFKWCRCTNMRRKLRKENGSICGKNTHKNQEEKRSRKKFIWSTTKDEGPCHRKVYSWSVFSYYHIYIIP